MSEIFDHGNQQDTYRLGNTSTHSRSVASQIPATEEGLRAIAKNLQSYFASQSPEQLKLSCANLLDIASLPDIPSGHRIAAFNTLCGFVGQCLGSADIKVKEIAHDARLCFALLMLYLQRYENSRAKSMKQLLGCVTKAIARQPAGPGLYSKTESLHMLLTIVCDNDDEVQAKPAFHILAALVHKRLVSANELLDILDHQMANFHSTDQQTWQLAEVFLARLFLWVSRQDVAPIVGSFIPIFIQSLHGQELYGQARPMWLRPLAQFLQRAPEELPGFRFYVFPGVFGLDRKGYWNFLQHIGLYAQLGLPVDQQLADVPIASDSNMASLLFTALQVGKELGLVELSDPAQCPTISYNDQAILICDQLLGDILGDLDLGVRLSGMSLLISSKQQSRPLTKSTLESLKTYLPHSLLEPDANFRSEILSLTRILIERIKAVCSFLSRSIVHHEKHDHRENAIIAQNDLKRHKDFLLWLVQRVTMELHSNASYQRHVISLKILLILLKSGIDDSVPESELSKQAKSDLRWGFSVHILGAALQRLLFDALMDPFEDVRQLSAAILKLTSNSPIFLGDQRVKSSKTARMVPHICQVAKSRAQHIMLRSGRIDHADGYARIADVCFEFPVSSIADWAKLMPSINSTQHEDSVLSVTLLRENVSQIFDGINLAKQSLSAAVEQYPIHGLLTSVRYMLENAAKDPLVISVMLRGYPAFGNALETLVHDIWTCVKDTLCNDAPEGFLPDELDDEASMTTRDLLSYSWRALKESSLLLRSMVLCLQSLYVSAQEQQRVLESLGWLCFTQLAELRHRGAFSTVAQSFATVCLQCQSFSKESTESLNSIWYKATFDLIQAQGSKITRRSAGIPAAMVGLLGAGVDFAQAIADLERVASKDPENSGSEQVDLPQVHALNCLRSAFTSTKVVSESEPHLVKVTAIASRALKSDLWPIRNCGLMLLRSLIDRLLGSNEACDEVFDNATGSRLAYDRYPGLLELLKHLLTPSQTDDSIDQEVSLESLFPALDLLRRAPPPSETRASFLPLILNAAGSPQWHIREAAARAFAAVATDTQFHALNIDETLLTGEDNMAHGKLLCLKYYLLVAMQRSKDNGNELSVLRDMAIFMRRFRDCSTAIESRPPIIAKTLFDSISILSASVLEASCKTTDSPNNLKIEDHLHVAIIRTTRTKPVKQGRLAGESSRRSSETLAYISSLLNDHIVNQISRNSTEIGSLIQTELSHLDPEGFDFVVKRILSISAEAEAPSQILLPFADALTVFISCQLHSPTATQGVTLQETTNSWRIRDIARSATASILRHSGCNPGQLPDSLSQMLVDMELSKDCWVTTAPSSIQGLLGLWGASLDAKYRAGKTWTQTILGEGLLWINYVSTALTDLNEFPLRNAAVLSLDGFKEACGSLADIPDTLAVSIIFASYTALNDDDEDIRNVAARVATRLLSRPGVGRDRVLSAAVSSVRLCDLLVSKYSTISQVSQEVVIRMTGRRFSFKPFVATADVSDGNTHLQASLEEDTTLFVIEKQNLYIDSVRESEIWSGVLGQLSASAISAQMVEELSKWALSGLEGLVSYAKSNDDGPLGWASKPEVFALGVQFFVTADVLLTWRSKKVQEVEQASKLWSVLEDLLKVADKASLHELWVQKVKNIVHQHLDKPHQ